MRPRPHLLFLTFKTESLAPELQVSMGPSPHLWFLHAKQLLLDQNYRSLWVPDLTYGFCIQNSAFSTRIASLYGSQPSSVVLCIHNSDIMTRINSLYWSHTLPVRLWMQNSVLRSRMTLVYRSQPSSVVLCIQNSDFSIRITSLYGSQPLFVAFVCKTATLGQQLQVCVGPSPYLWLLYAKQRL